MISQPGQMLDGCVAGRWGVVSATWTDSGGQDTDSTLHAMGVRKRRREMAQGQMCTVEGRKQSHPAVCHF